MRTLLARQPIFDLRQRVVGYELFYGGSRRDDGAEAAMAQDVVVDAVLGIGLERVTEGHPAFLKVTEEMLLNGSVELLDRYRVVLVVDGASLEPEAAAVCARLVPAGYRLVLDDPAPGETPEALLRAAEMARIRVPPHPDGSVAGVAEALRPFGLRLLAAGVDGAAARDACVEMGFELFQGYRFDHPEVVTGRTLGIECLQTFRLMKEIRDPDTPEAVIEEGFRRDVALSYKLLRIVNSAAVGGREIRSIGQAIRLLGRDALNRWLALLLVSSAAQAGVHREQAQTALLRGRMCEILAGALGRPRDAGALFIVGLFSMLDLLLRAPMEEVVAQMGFAPEVDAALLRREGELGRILGLVEAYEVGEWEVVTDRCRELAMEKYDLSAAYFDALAWAGERAAVQAG